MFPEKRRMNDYSIEENTYSKEQQLGMERRV
jgi:hypothetical protein